MATTINLLRNNPKLRRLRAIQADKLFWLNEQRYAILCWQVMSPDFLFAGKYLWVVAVTFTVLRVWGWM